jgi:hypothetical protein
MKGVGDKRPTKKFSEVEKDLYIRNPFYPFFRSFSFLYKPYSTVSLAKADNAHRINSKINDYLFLS